MEGQKPEEQNQNSNFSFRLFYNSLIDAMSFIPFFAFVGVAFTNNSCYTFSPLLVLLSPTTLAIYLAVGRLCHTNNGEKTIIAN